MSNIALNGDGTVLAGSETPRIDKQRPTRSFNESPTRLIDLPGVRPAHHDRGPRTYADHLNLKALVADQPGRFKYGRGYRLLADSLAEIR